MSAKTTILPISYYDVSEYTLQDTSAIQLNELNYVLMRLFLNDLQAYSMLVGKFRGVWWKRWYKGVDDGYELGDVVVGNGIEEAKFISSNWQAIKRIADYGVVDDPLPDYQAESEIVLDRYLDVAATYFYLGNKYEHPQLYISLEDSNKERPTNSHTWQPYLVTEEELEKKTSLIQGFFKDLLQSHETDYHTGLDILDAADSEYESGKTLLSIYQDTLLSYFPSGVETRSSSESELWVEFLANEDGLKTYSQGLVSHELFHILKPLGDEKHWIETKVFTDGEIRVSGFIHLPFLQELIPPSGTAEYNKWKGQGIRRFAIQIDYPLNDSLSKLYFYNEVEEDLTGAALAKAVSRQIAEESTIQENQPYHISNRTEDVVSVILFLNYCKDSEGNPIQDISRIPTDLDPPTEEEEGDFKLIEKLLGDGYTYRTNSDGDEDTPPTTITYTFTKVDKGDALPDMDSVTEESSFKEADHLTMMRLFGFTNSPTISTPLSSSISPYIQDGFVPISSSFPTIELKSWNMLNGQQAIITVPETCQEASFEITGRVREDEVEGRDSLFYTGVGLSWVKLVVELEKKISLIEYLLSVEKISADDPRAVLAGNMNDMVERLKSRLVAAKSTCYLMPLRNISITPLQRLAQGLQTECSEEEEEDYTLIQELYVAYSEYVEERFKYSGFYELFSMLSSDYYLDDTAAETRKVILRDALKASLNINMDVSCKALLDKATKRANTLSLNEISSKVAIRIITSMVEELQGRLEEHKKWLEDVNEDTGVKDMEVVEKLKANFISTNILSVNRYKKDLFSSANDIEELKAKLDSYQIDDVEKVTAEEIIKKRKYLQWFTKSFIARHRDSVSGVREFLNFRNIMYSLSSELDEAFSALLEIDNRLNELESEIVEGGN